MTYVAVMLWVSIMSGEPPSQGFAYVPVYFGMGGVPAGAFVGMMIGLLRPREGRRFRHMHELPRPAGAG